MFLSIMAAVPLIQILIEIRGEDGIRAFEVFSQTPTATNLRTYERNLETASWAATSSRPWIQYARFKWLKDGGEKAVIGRDGWYFYKPGLDYMLARFDREAKVNTTNNPFAAIVDFRDQLAARGIRLLIIPVPNKESVYPDRLTSRAGGQTGVLAPRTQDLLEKLRGVNVEVIDLFKEFGAARLQNDSVSRAPLYLAQDTHWSPAGVDLAARTVANRLFELGWIKPGLVDYNERTAPAKRLGDILRMLRMPPLESRMTPESVPCVQVVNSKSGELYKDEAGAEILLLGDSFSRVFQQDEPGSAGFVAHLARELKQPLISLVNDGGGSTLVRRELNGRPAFLKNKKVVLWEFVERDIGLGLEGWKLVPLPVMPSPQAPGDISEKPLLLKSD